jgi:hypothetical protein
MKLASAKSLLLVVFFFIIELSKGQTVLLVDSFASGALPSGWSQDSGGVAPFYSWAFNNPGSRALTGAGFDTSFVIFDSDHFGQNNSEDCYLTLPSLNASVLTSLFLLMDEQYRPGTNQFHQVEVSTNNGVSWHSLLSDSLSAVGYPSPVHSTYDISSIAAGHAAVKIRFHFAGSWGWWWAIDNVKVLDSVLCLVPPSAGQTVTSKQYVCSVDTFTLSLANNSNGLGETFQWQSSVDGLSWTNLTGDSTSSALVNQTDATYYRCLVTCSGLSSYSDSIVVQMNPNLFCYCTPVSAPCTGIDFIGLFAISGTPLFDSTGCGTENTINYSFFAPDSLTTATLSAGTSYDFIAATNNTNSISIWIDYNQNYVFESNEWAQISSSTSPGVNDTVRITIPVTALNGLTGLRIRSRLFGSPNDSSSACTPFGSGETEDYLVTIDNGIGIHENSMAGFSLFPSPSNGRVEIRFGTYAVDQAAIWVYDVFGNRLKQQTVSHASGSRLDLTDLANGIYFVKVETAKGSWVRKIILNK